MNQNSAREKAPKAQKGGGDAESGQDNSRSTGGIEDSSASLRIGAATKIMPGELPPGEREKHQAKLPATKTKMRKSGSSEKNY